MDAPAVECKQFHASINVSDLAAAIDFYTKKLGFRLAFTWGDPPNFAGVNLGEVQLFLNLGQPQPKGCLLYFLIDDLDALFEFHRQNGVEVVQEPADHEWAIRDYVVSDPFGYHLLFGKHLQNAGPKIAVRRVEVPDRLEQRLAALLQDLAAHKGMNIDSCLEEMLLHTNDGVGPHTERTLKHIQELKKKHGIDYDTHASYRFVEE